MTDSTAEQTGSSKLTVSSEQPGSSGPTGASGQTPLVIIAGATATGKSAVAVELAKQADGAVISADSMQVYRGMDIGSAKITPEEMQGIPHYLIDIADPKEEWNVVRFQGEAKKAVRKITGEGKLPILCGGTGFYIQALLYGIDFTEMEEDTSYRSELTAIAQTQGPEVLHRMLEECDPESAAAIHPNNVKRVIRALEFEKQSGGLTISEHNRRERERRSAYNACYFVLDMDRELLYPRIDMRVDQMFDKGLVKEVEKLRSEGLTDRDVSMQGLGYKEILRALDGKCTIEEARRTIKLETRHFAKRQVTWFKREKEVVWIRRTPETPVSQITGQMLTILKEKRILPS